MRGSNFCRRKHTPFRIPPVLGQLSEYPSDRGTGISVPLRNHEPVHVLKEEPLAVQIPKDSSCRRPQVAGIVGKQPLPCEAVSLARDSRNDAIHDSTPRSAVEGSHIAEHRRWSHAAFFHRANQIRGAECVSLNVADDASAWNCQLDAESEGVDGS